MRRVAHLNGVSVTRLHSTLVGYEYKLRFPTLRSLRRAVPCEAERMDGVERSGAESAAPLRCEQSARKTTDRTGRVINGDRGGGQVVASAL